MLDHLKRPPTIWYHEERDILGIFATSIDGTTAMVIGMNKESDLFVVERLPEPGSYGWVYICEFYSDDRH